MILKAALANEPRSEVVVVTFKVELDTLLGSVVEVELRIDVVEYTRLSMFPRWML
jgi:hypothetical protein